MEPGLKMRHLPDRKGFREFCMAFHKSCRHLADDRQELNHRALGASILQESVPIHALDKLHRLVGGLANMDQIVGEAWTR